MKSVSELPPEIFFCWICPFFWEAMPVIFSGPKRNVDLMPNSAELDEMNVEFVASDTLPASTLCTISSLYPVYFILS